MDTLILTWGLLPTVLGLGFVFRPRLMRKLERAYSQRAQRIQKRFLKAHRATGLFLILIGVVMLLSWFYPVWIFNCFLLARIVIGAVFPALFIPTHPPIIPTQWI